MANSRLAARWPLDAGAGNIAQETQHMLDGTLGALLGGPGPVWIPGPRTPGIPTDTALHFGGDDFVAVEDVGCLEPQRLTVECCVRGEVHDDDPTTNTAKPLAYIVSKGAASDANAS